MKEISLNILDIAENSVKAGATLIEIGLTQTGTVLQIVIKDNGCGMSPEILKRVENPFYTTRTTRSVGLGIPFYKLAAEQTGGNVVIESVQKGENVKEHGIFIIGNGVMYAAGGEGLGRIGNAEKLGSERFHADVLAMGKNPAFNNVIVLKAVVSAG